MIPPGLRGDLYDAFIELFPVSIDFDGDFGEQFAIGTGATNFDGSAGAGRGDHETDAADLFQRDIAKQQCVSVVDGSDKAATAGVAGIQNLRPANFFGEFSFHQPLANEECGGRGQGRYRAAAEIRVGGIQAIVAGFCCFFGVHGDITNEPLKDADKPGWFEAVDPADHFAEFFRRMMGMGNHWNLTPHAG